MKKNTLLTLLILNIATSALAQTQPVGRYLFKDFDRGYGIMKKGMPISDLFNYDVVNEQMQFLDNGEKMALVMPDLDTLRIDNRIFVPIGNKFAECIKLENGVELKVLWHSKEIEMGRKGAYGISTQGGGVNNLYVGDCVGEHAYQDYETMKDLNTYSYKYNNTYLATIKGKTFKFHDAKSFAKTFQMDIANVEATMKKNNWYFGIAKNVVELLYSMEFK